MQADVFRGQVAIVTGASAGIGRALALQLAGQGAKVALAARRADRLEEVAKECRAAGGQALVIPTDVGVEAQCRELVERTVAEYGRLDLLINNAGFAVSGLFGEFPNLDLFKRNIDVNFFGGVYPTYYALPHLKKTKGRIVGISSIGALAPLPYNTPYIASKHALRGFYDSLRLELTTDGVSVTVIYPSWVVSEFHEAQMNKNGVPVGARGRSIYKKWMMTAEQCAAITLRAAYRRRREVIMGRGPLAAWLRLVAPRALDWFIVKVFMGSILRRARRGANQPGEAK